MCSRRSFYTDEGGMPRFAFLFYLFLSFSRHNLYHESRVIATIARVRFNVIVILRLLTTFFHPFLRLRANKKRTSRRKKQKESSPRPIGAD